MRFITADYIFPISSPPIKNGVIAVQDDGVIEDVLASGQPITQNPKLETYSGIICPGFINAHCHLELSHLKGKFFEGKGLPHFIGEIISKREEKKEIIAESIVNAEDEMIRNGIVAVGDICNTDDTISQKNKGRLRYHNFIEVFDLHPDRAEIEFEKGKMLLNEFKKLNQSCSITPHAPYSVSPKLLKLISEFNIETGELGSIHNQETESENEMFIARTGELFKKLASFGNLYDTWQPNGINSLAYTLNNIDNNKTLLVHNTYTSKTDMDFITSNHKPQTLKLSWCFCPNANLFIENLLPDFNLFIDQKCEMLIGTDSYASNWSLSVLDELKTIQKRNPEIRTDELLKWATLNGAEFFGWQNELGSIEKGKKPGLNLISNINEHTLSLSDLAEVKPLLN